MGHERCEACGFDGSALDDRALLEGLHALGPEWADALAGAGDLLRSRPAPDTWSALEYAAHSRDITALHVWAVEQALGGAEPVLPEVDGDDLIEAASAEYASTDPAEVVGALEDQADRLADVARQPGPPHGAGASPSADRAPTSVGCSSTPCTTPGTTWSTWPGDSTALR